MAVDFKLSSEISGDTLILKTDGYINKSGGEEILQEFTRYADAVKKVVIDMEKSNVVNSIGISYFIDIVEKLCETEGRLIFLNLDPIVDKTFELMGMFQYAEKADSLQTALKS